MAEEHYGPAPFLAEADFPRALSIASESDSSDPQERISHYLCPCGSRDFKHIIKPPPPCLALRHTHTHNFPELTVCHPEEISAMKQHLCAQTERLKHAFVVYGAAVRRYARSTENVEPILRDFVELQEVDVADTANFDTLYRLAKQQANFLNPTVLNSIVKACNDIYVEDRQRELRQEVETTRDAYDVAFMRFIQLRTFVDGKLPRPPVQDLHTTYPKLKIKMQEELTNINPERLDLLKDEIRRILFIPETVFLRITDIEEGCVLLTFKIIGNICKENFELTHAQKGALASKKISLLEYDGIIYYCCCSLMSDKDIIKQLYSTSDQHHCNKVSSPAIANSTTDPAAKNKEIHSPYCPSTKDSRLKCPRKECVYCNTKVYYCIIEFHDKVCEKRRTRLNIIKEAKEKSETRPNSSHKQASTKESDMVQHEKLWPTNFRKSSHEEAKTGELTSKTSSNCHVVQFTQYSQ